jgi:AraC family transcriptional regulator, positive regulator of tynA and feaB
MESTALAQDCLSVTALSDPVGYTAGVLLPHSVADHLDGAAALSIINHLVELVAMAVGVSSREEDRALRTLRNQLTFSLINYINSQTADPKFTPAKAAAHFRISVRYVHRLLDV